LQTGVVKLNSPIFQFRTKIEKGGWGIVFETRFKTGGGISCPGKKLGTGEKKVGGKENKRERIFHQQKTGGGKNIQNEPPDRSERNETATLIHLETNGINLSGEKGKKFGRWVKKYFSWKKGSKNENIREQKCGNLVEGQGLFKFQGHSER